MSRHPALLTLCAALLLAPAASAQTTQTQTTPAPTSSTPSAAAPTLDAVRALVAQARAATPSGKATIDQTVWKRAAAAADALAAAQPQNADALRVRAQVYTEVGFWRQAERSWNALFKVQAPTAGDQDAKAAATVQYNLGYAAYTLNQPSAADAAFRACLELDPNSAQCATWAARTALEGGDYARAQTLYDRALKLSPNDRTLSYFRALAGSASRYGPAATRAFSRAYEDREAGRKPQALSGFQEAARSAPNFAEAWREAGRLALELGDAPAALAAYQGATALPGATAADRYNLALAQEGAQYGLGAVQAFRAAYAKYVAGDKAGAEAGFLDATAKGPKYAKAFAWLGRVRAEAKNYAGAVEAYTQAVTLNPDDAVSAYQLRLARQNR